MKTSENTNKQEIHKVPTYFPKWAQGVDSRPYRTQNLRLLPAPGLVLLPRKYEGPATGAGVGFQFAGCNRTPAQRGTGTCLQAPNCGPQLAGLPSRERAWGVGVQATGSCLI